MKRDTYNDYFTMIEAVERGFWFEKSLARRVADLKMRSGFSRCSSARYTSYCDLQKSAFIMRVSFSSSAWTGR